MDAAIDSLVEAIIGSADYCIPRFAPKPNNQREVPAHILQLVSQRNRFKNVYYRTKNTCLKPAINSLTRQISSLIRIWKTSLWEEQHRRTHDDHRRSGSWTEAQIPRSEPSNSTTVITYYRPWSRRRNSPKGTKSERPREPHQHINLGNRRRLLATKAPSSSHIANRNQHTEELMVGMPQERTTSHTFF